MMHVKKNDTVVVLSGKDKGKQGTVIDILPRKGKIFLKGINMVTCHVKARRQGETPMIKQKESALAISTVMFFCRSCVKPSRINVQLAENNTRVRICNRCKKNI